MSEMISNGFFTDSKGNRLEVVDASARKRAEEAYAKAENVSSGYWEKLIPALTTPFTTTGVTVYCHPVPDYPLQAITHFTPEQDGEGDPAPDNIWKIQPVSRVYLNHNGRIAKYSQNLSANVYGGDYNWHLGTLTGKAKYLELDGNEGWYLNQNGDTSYFVHQFSGLIGIENKAYMSHYANRPALSYSDPAGTYNVFRYQNHSSGVTRLCVRPDLGDYDLASTNSALAQWKQYLAAQKAAGTPVQLVYFTTNGDEEQGYPETQILPYEGENEFNAGPENTVTISGQLNPVWQNAQQDQRIAALEAAILNG